jgi:exopolysaccharide biosynthesis polyprenyl glycosylphosphotransferase
MARFVANHVSPEMVALWLLELVLSFSLAYILLSTGSMAAGVQPTVVNHSLILALTCGFTAFAVGLYRPEGFRRMRGLLLNTALGGVLAFPAVWLVSKALGIGVDQWIGPDALWPLKVGAAWIAALFATRLLFLAAVRSNLLVRPVALLGAASTMAPTIAAIRGGHEGFFEVVVGPVANAGPARLRAAGIRNAVLPRSALLAMSPREQASYAAQGVALATEAQFWERCLKRVDVSNVDDAWIAGLDAPRWRLSDLLSRTGDILISLAFLVLTLPIMLVVALLVRLSGPGPVLYRQERVGLGGHSFTLLKFRSMRVDAETRGPAWATQRDPRVTGIGSFMRRTRIDELPQLLNVLQGAMSFIGPRPERPHFVEQLAQAIPHYRERARVKPGLTGWAQVNFPYGASIEDARVKLSYDLYYVKHRGVLLDLAILFATVRVILFQEGSR